MVFYSIDDIKPDMVLGEDILESSGKLLLKEGFILKETHIELLKRRGYSKVGIKVEGTDDIKPKIFKSQEKLESSITESQTNIKKIFKEQPTNNKEILYLILTNKPEINK